MMWISVRSMGTQDAGEIPNFFDEVAESLDITLTIYYLILFNTSRMLDWICNRSMPSNLFLGTLGLYASIRQMELALYSRYLIGSW